MASLVPVNKTLTSIRHRINRTDARRFGLILAVISSLVIWGLMASAYLPARYDLTVGDVSPGLINAPRTLTFENQAETERRRQQAGDEVTEVYAFDGAVLPRVSNNINTFFTRIDRINNEERTAAQAASQPYDSAKSAARIGQLTGMQSISSDTIAVLAQLDPVRITEVRTSVLNSAQRILEGNVTDVSLETDKARLQAVLATMPLNGQDLAAASEIAPTFLEPNYTVDVDKTKKAKEEAATEVQPAIVTVRNGETILTPGEVVTAEKMAVLEALGLTHAEEQNGAIAGIGLLVLIEALLMLLYIARFEKSVVESRSLQFIVASLLVLFTALGRISVIPPLSPLLVPVAALGIMGTILLKTRLSMIMVALASMHIIIVGGSEPQYLLVALIGGITGVFLATNVTQRRDLLVAGLVTGAVVTATAAGASQLSENSLSQLLESTLWGAANGLLAIVVSLGLLSVYDMAFNLLTPFKLLELADPTRPILKDLMMKAPGTYSHSIIMGNIAESAAEAIGANPLLARVGAYYHDIGKLNRPEYFIENQFHVKNPHDRLTPNLSRLAITAHVKDGVRLARDEGLPPEIVDIIEEHHGTTVLSYFFHKAQETDPLKRVEEESYRYAGKKPASREAAIIMLADSVEAAVRSLANPTIKNIKTTIRNIFDQRLRDGQLSESRLTFGDLEKVRLEFEQSLQGFGATRIAYPGGAGDEGGSVTDFKPGRRTGSSGR